MTIPALAWPLVSLLALPLGWLEYRLLQKTRWGLMVGIVAAPAIFGPWIFALLHTARTRTVSDSIVGIALAGCGLVLWLTAAPRILRVPGQIAAAPTQLVTTGPYRWTRHPLYVSLVLMISGMVLGFGARQVFLETPLLWAIAAAGSFCEERFILTPRFGQSYHDLRRRTAFLLPTWAWALWGLLYLSVAWRVWSG
jgi:protein-S-isoprenylcysteine O-methyltransferase Ste14